MIRISVHSLVRVTVTYRPSRLARWLLGRVESVREAHQIRWTRVGGGSWVYGDNREVEPEVLRAIERAVEAA